MHRSTALLLAAALAGCGRDAPPPPPGPPIALAIERASAENTAHGLHVSCDAVLQNDTGAPIEVRTNFASVFDGVSVVVSRESGEELSRRAYIHHQSPYSPGDRPIPLQIGSTRQSLLFPIDGLRVDSRSVRVKLVGGLPGTTFTGGLVSNELQVTVR